MSHQSQSLRGEGLGRMRLGLQAISECPAEAIKKFKLTFGLFGGLLESSLGHGGNESTFNDLVPDRTTLDGQVAQSQRPKLD